MTTILEWFSGTCIDTDFCQSDFTLWHLHPLCLPTEGEYHCSPPHPTPTFLFSASSVSFACVSPTQFDFLLPSGSSDKMFYLSVFWWCTWWWWRQQLWWWINTNTTESDDFSFLSLSLINTAEMSRGEADWWGDAVHIDQDDHKLFQVKSLISLPFPSGYLRFLPSQDLDIMTWKTNVFSSLLIIFHVFPPPHTHTPMFKWTYLFIYSQINILLA